MRTLTYNVYMKLLLVDDDAFLRDMYVTKFTEAGHTVSVAASAIEGLALLEAGDRFDVVLLDMVMPGMSGVAFLEKMQSVDGIEKTKRIVLSNQGEESDKDAATAAGACGYIVKAESIPSEVVKKVESLVS